MPELPEVETMRRGIAPVVGAKIERVARPRSPLCPIQIEPPLALWRRRVVGRRIVAVGRLGKRVVLELDSLDRVVIEPRMTGRVLLESAESSSESSATGRYRGDRHRRLVFDLAESPAGRIVFWDSRGLGVARLLRPEEFARRLGPDVLGPDALTIPVDILRQRLQGSRRAIKVALLDQRAVAGIGNLYASEILHRAKLHPAMRCCDLTGRQWRAVHERIGEVLEEAIARQGSTLSDGMYRTAENRPGGFQECHRVYQRTGQPCLACGEAIVRIVQAQRSTFFCPRCQGPG